jgi:hypothetical protein
MQTVTDQAYRLNENCDWNGLSLREAREGIPSQHSI